MRRRLDLRSRQITISRHKALIITIPTFFSTQFYPASYKRAGVHGNLWLSGGFATIGVANKAKHYFSVIVINYKFLMIFSTRILWAISQTKS
jgi:hypothetical protein